MASGALAIVGFAEALTARSVFSTWGINWSSTEIRLLGVSRLIWGLSCGLYVLIFGLTLGARVIPEFWVGHPWGLFVSAPIALVSLGTLFFQAVLVSRHKESLPSNRGGHPST
jgi:hypothetical protein